MVWLKDICKPKQWKTISSNLLEDSGYPVYGANGIIGHYNEFTHENPTVLITCRGATCGTINICQPKSYVNGNAMALDELSDKVSINYLSYILIARGLDDVISGSAQPQITRTNLNKVKIPLPSLETQKRIAAILDDAQALKQKTEQLLSEYDALAQSIFLDMFGDPVTNPKGWELNEFKDVCENKNSNRVPIKKEDRAMLQGNYPYYGATGIVDYINDYKFNGEYLLIAEDGKNLVNRKKPIAWIAKGKFWVNNHAHVVEHNGCCDLTFLAYQLNGFDISKYVTGIDQFKMNKNNLNRIPVPIPPLELQTEFANKIALIEQQKELAKKELEESEDLFNCLLQKAFKGELV